MIFSDLQPNDIWRLNGSARERDKIYTATISYRKINKKQMSSAIKTCHIFTVNKIWRYSAHKRQLNEYKTQFKRWINLAKCCYSWVLMLSRMFRPKNIWRLPLECAAEKRLKYFIQYNQHTFQWNKSSNRDFHTPRKRSLCVAALQQTLCFPSFLSYTIFFLFVITY